MCSRIQYFFHLPRHLSVKNQADVKKFGIHLRKVRNSRNLSQQQLADMANIAKTTLQRIELGRQVVSIDTLISIAKALEISVSELVKF